MAKTKKKGLAEKTRTKKKETTQKINPFEVKINRQKHDVLGRKLGKHDKGMPGVSRSKAIKKRKETLLVEFQERKKSNKFLDRRFGENDPEMGLEDKMLKRFTKERQRGYEKSSLFSLNDEDELTHYGQSLSEIEKFEDPVVSDDEDDEDKGKIGAKVVAAEHFGGFLTRKEEEERREGEEEGRSKTWKERMEEIIAKSKKEKYERQHEREKTLEQTEKLDAEWKELRDLMTGGSKKKAEEPPAKSAADDYDIMVRELKFEIKGKPLDRLKTEEEMAREEKERLEKLEEDRKRRMQGVAEEEEPDTHKSADDLDDGFSLGKKDRKVRFEVAFKDGALLKGTEEGEEEPSEVAEEEEEEGEAEEGSEEEEDDEEEDEGEAEEAESGSGEEETEETEVAEGDDDDEEEGEEEDSDEDAMMGTSDLESVEEEEAAEEEEVPSDQGQKPEKKKSKKAGADEPQKKSILKKTEEFKRVLKERKEMMEKARQELPYTFKAPETYEELLSLLEGHSDDDQITILERLRKCHHPSLAEGNKAKLEVLFGLLFEYYGDLAIQEPPHFSLMERLLPHIYQLSQMAPLVTGTAVQEVIKSRQTQLNTYAEAHSGRGVYPALDVLMQLKLIGLLFPTSDFYHHVVTPATLYMGQLITQCPINTRRDIASGLFVCNLFLEYVSMSKRFVPEVINFLCGVLFLSCKKEENKVEPVIPPFKPVGRSISFLELQTGKKARSLEVKAVKLSDVFSKRRALHLGSDEFRVGCLFQALGLLQRFLEIYKSQPAAAEIFSPVAYFAEKIHIKHYPQKIKEQHKSLLSAIEELSSAKRKALTLQKQLPPALKLFEPKFEEVFDDTKRRSGSRQQNERQRLVYKHKKEMKGAMRELRRDAQFLANEKLQDRLEKDAERKRKVKELYASLANQEGDFQALKRKKNSA